MTKPFTPSRDDGRSDKQVILDLVHGAEPGTLFDYEVLLDALEDGLEERPDRARAQRAIQVANKMLLRERKRYLGNVRGRGYRLILTEEFLPVAINRKERAQGHLKRGLELLRNARLDELTEAQRTLHEGQLMVMAGVYQAVKASEARHERQEEIIATIIRQQEQITEEVRRQQKEVAERLKRLEKAPSEPASPAP